jgi:hypothetical protein
LQLLHLHICLELNCSCLELDIKHSWILFGRNKSLHRWLVPFYPETNIVLQTETLTTLESFIFCIEELSLVLYQIILDQKNINQAFFFPFIKNKKERMWPTCGVGAVCSNKFLDSSLQQVPHKVWYNLLTSSNFPKCRWAYAPTGHASFLRRKHMRRSPLISNFMTSFEMVGDDHSW